MSETLESVYFIMYDAVCVSVQDLRHRSQQLLEAADQIQHATQQQPTAAGCDNPSAEKPHTHVNIRNIPGLCYSHIVSSACQGAY